MCQHEIVALRPRVRDEAYKEVQVTEEQHSRALLEHHKHATDIVKFLISQAGLRNDAYPRPFRIVVFSRFDGDIANPFDDALVCDFLGNAKIPPQNLLLYNSTGNSHTGLHYDPVTEIMSRVDGRAVDSTVSEAGLPNVRTDKKKRLRRSHCANPHDEMPSYLNISRRCRGDCAGGDTCTESAASKASVSVAENGINECHKDIDDGDAPLVDEKEVGTLYEVWAMEPSGLPDDLRLKLEEAIHTLSFEFRDHPTLPGDPSDASKAISGALDKTIGLLLPLKHCAFRYCLWCGRDDKSLVEHILSEHFTYIKSAMGCFHILRPVVPYNEELLAMSVYNEGLAVATRRGAPLASYSIDRRCLQEYAKHMTNEHTYAAVCFVCARRFTHVSGSQKHNDIEHMNLIKNAI